jgi:site-specific DNA-adenine methylase
MKQPFTTYNGGKSGNGTYQTIINNIPKHKVYIEAMAGNGGILFHFKTPAAVIVINDIDRSVIDKYNEIKETIFPGQKVKIYNLDYYEVVRSIDRKNLLANIVNPCSTCSKDNNDYNIEKNNDDLFFYFDPPYLKETRKSQADLYKYEWSEKQHIDFLIRCQHIRGNVMVSHYPSSLYDRLLKGWFTLEFTSQTRNGKATEKLYMNYDPTKKILQDFSWVGSNFSERQRIKRKVERHIKKLDQLTSIERRCILSAILQKYETDAGEMITRSDTGKSNYEISQSQNQL